MLAPRVMAVPPSTTRIWPVLSLDAWGNPVDGSPYGYTSSVPGTVAVDGAGQLTTNTVLNFAQITATSTGRRPAMPWVVVNMVAPMERSWSPSARPHRAQSSVRPLELT